MARSGVVAVLAVLLLAVALAAAAAPVSPFVRVTDEVRAHFKQFVARFEKVYGADEYEERLAHFAANLLRIERLQRGEHAGGAVYGVTKFADLHPSEFRAHYLSAPRPDTSGLPRAPAPAAAAAASWDWAARGAVTAVKNQGQCGSCWAFSTTGLVEGTWFVAGHPLVALSEQQLVDCVTKDAGCNGGLPSDALAYILHAGGLESEAAYPYSARDESCHFDKSKIAASITKWSRVSSNEDTMAATSQTNGPLSIGINADFLQFYVSGVANPSNCNPRELNHGVLITGWGESGSTPYWSIKNSWGANWGEHGYFRIVRGSGKCGLNADVTTAVSPHA